MLGILAHKSFFFHNFIYLWLCRVFAGSRAFLQLECEGPSFLPLGLLGSRVQAVVVHRPSCSFWHVGSSQTRDWTVSPALAHHWATREGFAHKGFTQGSDSFDSAEALCVSNQNRLLFWRGEWSCSQVQSEIFSCSDLSFGEHMPGIFTLSSWELKLAILTSIYSSWGMRMDMIKNDWNCV